MTEVDYSDYSKVKGNDEPVQRHESKVSVSVVQPQSKPIAQPLSPKQEVIHGEANNHEREMEAKLETIGAGSSVVHKKFGKGTVVKLNRNDRFIYVKFILGEKKFVFPDAFLMGFLEMGK